MFITLDPDSETPIYRQIVEAVRRAIAGGDLAPGDGLPSVRQLAVDLGINLNTVAEAYRELQRQGLVETTHGRGTFVAGRRDATAGDASGHLRAAIVDLLLAGRTRRQILAEIEAELTQLLGRRRTS